MLRRNCNLSNNHAVCIRSVLFKNGRSIFPPVCRFNAIIISMLCVSWQFYYKDLHLLKHSLLLLMNVDFLPQLLHIFICLQRMESRVLKNISKKIFLLWQITEKKNSTVLFQKEKKQALSCFFPLERLSNKAGALGKNKSAGFAQWNGKSTLFYYHFKLLTDFSVE